MRKAPWLLGTALVGMADKALRGCTKVQAQFRNLDTIDGVVIRDGKNAMRVM